VNTDTLSLRFDSHSTAFRRDHDLSVTEKKWISLKSSDGTTKKERHVTVSFLLFA